MKFTEGGFRNRGYELAKREFGAVEIAQGPWQRMNNPKSGKEIIIKDVIADAFLRYLAPCGPPRALYGAWRPRPPVREQYGRRAALEILPAALTQFGWVSFGRTSRSAASAA